MYQPGGRHADINMLLYHVQHGMLYFVGMDVLPPFVAYGPTRASEEKRCEYLDSYAQRLLALETTPPLHFSYTDSRQALSGWPRKESFNDREYS